MADPLTMAVVGSAALSVVGGVLGAVGAREQAEAEAKQAKLEELQLESEKNLAELQSVQEEVIRREDLRRALSAQNAVAGGSGLAVNSRSFLARSGETRRLAERDIANVRIFGQAQSNRLAIGASSARARGKAALTQGGRAAFGSVLSGVAGGLGAFTGGAGQSLLEPTGGSGFTKPTIVSGGRKLGQAGR